MNTAKEKGRLIVISAPAGTGKTTLVEKLKQEFPEQIVTSISCTTRKPRPGEIDGWDYAFLTKEAFLKRIEQNEFLEHAVVFGEYYGTLKEPVKKQQEAGKNVILVIDTQGAKQLRKKIEALFIFITPPSIEILEERLKKRKTESLESLRKRLKWAQYEVDQAKNYDYVIVNDDLETAYQELKSIIISKNNEGENHGTRRTH